MDTLLISELADRAGVPVSTVRYYERVGLMPAPTRSHSGYRLYDEASAARLTFIVRAKGFGLALGEIGELADAWIPTDCGSTRASLRSRVATKRARIEEQICELEQFARQLAEVEARLDVDDAPEACGPDLECCAPSLVRAGSTPVTMPTLRDVPIACTLPLDDRPARVAELSAVAERVRSWRRDANSIELRFDTAPTTRAMVVGLDAEERRCCSFLDFEVRESADTLYWIISAPSHEESSALAEFAPLLVPHREVHQEHRRRRHDGC